MTVVGAVLYGTTAAIPLFLQTLLPFPALQAGLALSPRGMTAFVTSIIVGRLVGKVKNRVMIGFGFAILAISSFMLGWINLEVGMAFIIWPSLINGIALSFIFVPLTTATMGHLPQQQIGNATGIFNLMRNLGGSFGISAVQTLVARRAQTHQALMVHNLTPFDQAYVDALQHAQTLLGAHASQVDAHQQALGLIYSGLQQQATLWAFVDNFRIFGVLCLFCIPLVLLFKHVKAKPGGVAMH
jgi:DHA2 family multidrug resistance protein